MDNQPAGNKPSKKRISIRKHLPLSIRVHYDIVRNWSPVKLAGLAAMSLIAVFGVLLVTQTVSPQSQASTNGSSSNPCAPASAPSPANEPHEYTLCTPTKLTLEQAGDVAKIVLANDDYGPATIGHVISNDPKCDSSTGDVITRIYNNIRVEGYRGGVNHVSFSSTPSEEHELEYSIMGYGDSDADYTMALYGKYLCMSITYWDNNTQFRTYKRFDLLYVEMTSKTRTDTGTTYQFASNRNVHWGEGSPDYNSGEQTWSCEATVDSSGQATSSFTLQADGADYFFQNCVKVEDSTGAVAFITFFVSKEDADPSEREPENNQEQEEQEQTETEDTQPEDTQTQDDNTQTDDQQTPVDDQENNDDDNDDTPTTISVDDFITTYSYTSDQKDLILDKDDELMGENIWEYDETETTHYASTEDAATYHPLLQAYIAEQNNEQSGTVINSVDPSDGTGNTGDPIVNSVSVNAADSQGSVGDTTTVPDTGILDDQSMAQLIGYVLVAAAILGAVRVLMVKKYKKVSR